MTIKQILAAIAEWSKGFENKLTDLESELEKRVVLMQNRLARMILEVLVEWFDWEENVLKNTPKNIRAVRNLELILDKFEREQISKELERFATELLSVGALTTEYFGIVGSPKKAIIENAIEMLRAVIGIDSAGFLLKGGYLDRLGKTPEVRKELRDYVLQSILTRRKMQDFRTGMQALIEGTKDTDGALLRYWRQYAFDVFNQAHEVVNTSMAESLNMPYFIYQGSIIATTRRFCEKRAGKVFSVDETKDWKNDPDLIDKKTKDSYNPLIERGRYNCRHFLNYISEAIARELRPDLP